MKYSRYLLLFLVFIPLLLTRDFTPDNELKYMSIADEALANGNFFAFTNHGIPYADKPPLYIWIVMLGKWLLGTHSMFFLGLFSLLPAFAVLYVMDRWIRNEVDTQNRLSIQLSLMTCVFFVGSAVVLRMDMLMTLFIVLSLYTFYRMYRDDGKDRRKQWLLAFYIFMALFTKGPVGLLMPIISIIVFLLVKKRIRILGRYLGWRVWALLFGCAAIWFTGVYIDGGKEYLYNLVFNQTVNRAVDSFHHKAPFYYYFVSIWYSMAPWSLLYAVLIFMGIKKRLITTDMEKLFAVVSATTFIFLSFVSSKIQIYMLPAYPFIAYLAGLMIPKLEKWNGVLKFTVLFPACVFVFVLPVVLCAPAFIPPQYLVLPVYIGAACFTAGSLVAFYFFFWKKNMAAVINSVCGGMLAAVFAASFAVPSLNPELGFKAMADQAQAVARENGIRQYSYYNVRSAENMDIYLHQPLIALEKDELDEANGTILFLRSRDIDREPEVKAVVEGKEQYRFGSWLFIVL